MEELISALTRNKKIRSLMRSIEKRRALYLIGCLLASRRMRDIYQNYIFKRKRVLNAIWSHMPLPRNLYIEGTNTCNARCAFCAYDKMKRPKMTMKMELFKHVIDQYINMGGRAIGLTPIVGDPLLDKFLIERLDYLDRKPQITDVGFYTNGIALTEDKIDRILEYRNTVINLSISFGGFDRDTFKKIMGTDQFGTVKENILYLLRRVEDNPNPNIIIKIDYRCPDSEDIDPLFKRLKDVLNRGLIRHDSLKSGFDNFGGLISEEVLGPIGLRLNFGKPKMGPCDIFFRKPLVLADGRINGCAERDLEASLIIGDVTKEPLKEILCSQRLRGLIEAFYKDEIPKICCECSVYQSIYDKSSKVWRRNLNWIDGKED